MITALYPQFPHGDETITLRLLEVYDFGLPSSHRAIGHGAGDFHAISDKVVLLLIGLHQGSRGDMEHHLPLNLFHLLCGDSRVKLSVRLLQILAHHGVNCPSLA